MLADQAISNFKTNVFTGNERRLKKRFFLANEDTTGDGSAANQTADQAVGGRQVFSKSALTTKGTVGKQTSVSIDHDDDQPYNNKSTFVTKSITGHTNRQEFSYGGD